jgi:hypothetical protein
MKALPLIALGVGALLWGSQSPKPVSVKKTYKNLDAATIKANEEAIIKYYSSEPLYVKDISDIMNLLTPSLQKEIQDGGNDIYVYLPLDNALFFYEAANIILDEKYKGQKGIINDSKKLDVITKDVLTKFANDVYWKEGLIPYNAGTPFFHVWTGVNTLVQIAAENREQKGL